MDSELENLLGSIVDSTEDNSELNKTAIKKLMKMDSDKERFEFIKSLGSLPLDNEGRQLISCPERQNAVCHLHTVYKEGEAKTVCTGPVLDKYNTSGVFGSANYVYRSKDAEDECPYNPSQQISDDQGDDLEDFF